MNLDDQFEAYWRRRLQLVPIAFASSEDDRRLLKVYVYHAWITGRQNVLKRTKAIRLDNERRQQRSLDI